VNDRSPLPPNYKLSAGSYRERSLLLRFLQRSYRELYPDRDFSHLAHTVEEYFSSQTPLWWVEYSGDLSASDSGMPSATSRGNDRIACLWLGNSVDQVSGERHAHVFLLYVMPEHRRRGIGSALMHHAEAWARNRGDRQIGLQVFTQNQLALELYRRRGYQPLSLWMLKNLETPTELDR